MWCRCKECNSIIDFRNRRGNKLSYSTCPCGGSYEMLSNTEVLGENTFEPQKTYLFHFGDNAWKQYYPALKNKKGDIYYHDRINRKAILINHQLKQQSV